MTLLALDIALVMTWDSTSSIRYRKTAQRSMRPCGLDPRRLARYGLGMRPMLVLAVVVAGVAAPVVAQAGIFGGFAASGASYVVGRDRVCMPLPVAAGKATGVPACRTAATDEVAQLSARTPAPDRGVKAIFVAEARGRTLSVARKQGGTVVAWESPDPIARVVDVYVNTYGTLIAVELRVRRASKEIDDVVAFDLRGAQQAPIPSETPPAGGPGSTSGVPGPTTSGPGTTTGVPAAEPKEVVQAVAAARKASSRNALAAWQRVLALDASHSEARYAVAVTHARSRRVADALSALEALAASPRPDAIEWLVAARFDRAFAALRTDPRFRTAVGLDRPARTLYERLMGFGGTWEQAGTSCDMPEVSLELARERTFQLRVKSRCSGEIYEDRFRGTWALEDPHLVLVLPNKERKDDRVTCSIAPRGGEDAITCQLDADLAFTVQPVRR